MGNKNHVVVVVVGHKVCCFQGCLGRHIVMMKEPVVVAPKFQSFSSHTFSQVSQNIRVFVKFRVDHCVRRNKFSVKKTIKTMSMLSVELWTCYTFLLLATVGSSTVMIVPLFMDHNCKSNFCRPL
jgi:hypothetical protein